MKIRPEGWNDRPRTIEEIRDRLLEYAEHDSLTHSVYMACMQNHAIGMHEFYVRLAFAALVAKEYMTEDFIKCKENCTRPYVVEANAKS